MWYTQYHFLHHIQQQTVVPAQKAGNHYITEWMGEKQKSICWTAAGMVYWLWETTVLQGGWPLFYIGWGWC